MCSVNIQSLPAFSSAGITYPPQITNDYSWNEGVHVNKGDSTGLTAGKFAPYKPLIFNPTFKSYLRFQRNCKSNDYTLQEIR